MASAPRNGLLLVTPCDPGECHIYFGVQRRAFPTAVSLARELNRTLVLPPFEWYEDQAQQFTNTFKRTPQGKVPRFERWSNLFDIDRLRAAGVDVVEFHEAQIKTINRAVLGTGNSGLQVPPPGPAVPEDVLAGHLVSERPCVHRQSGLRRNFTFAESTTDGKAVSGKGVLYTHKAKIEALRCGVLPVSRPEVIAALGAWFDDAPVAALFDVGHHTHTLAPDTRGGWSRTVVERSLRPNAELEREAARFVEEVVLAPSGASSRARGFVALHWRHGDWIDYKLLTPLESVIRRTRAALDEQLKCVECPVFLMTNCRNASALLELRESLPTLVTYEPAHAASRYALEGPRLVIEQSIAIRADAFVGMPRSAVSEFVETVRRVERPRSPTRPARPKRVYAPSKSEL